MDNTLEEDTFLYYEIRDNEILRTYSNDSKKYAVPYNVHNIEVCDRRLLKQHCKIKRESFPVWKMQVLGSINALSMVGMIGIASVLTKTHSVIPLVLMYVLKYSIGVIPSYKKMQRFKLTDYCLKNADKLKLEKKSILSLPLSDKAQQVLNQDTTFCLNSAHLYSTNDLKQLKKVIQR